MTREKEIEVLMKDGYTKKEAEDALKNGCVVYPDLEEGLEIYLEEFEALGGSEYAEKIRKMVETKKEILDWSIVVLDGKRYYIEHVN